MAMTRSLTPVRDGSNGSGVSRSLLWKFPPVLTQSSSRLSFDWNLLCLHSFIWLANGRDRPYPYS